MKSKVLNLTPCPVCKHLFCPGCPTTDGDRESAKKVADAMEVIFHELNFMGQENITANAVANAVIQNHRTLQQGLMNSVVRGIVDVFAWMHEEGHFDGRNEATCKLATDLKKVMDENYLPYI